MGAKSKEVIDNTDEGIELEHENRLRRGREAQELLQHPLVEGFFANHFRACYDAFVALPLGATLDQYRAVHFKLVSIRELRSELENYIITGKNELLRNQLLPNEEIDV